jgi:NAD(P)-dependent dehydrogenase (short-subunit alcohol dehydrogenase family)
MQKSERSELPQSDPLSRSQLLISVCRYQKRIPTGTFAEPEEVAHVVNMLVQDLSCNINGADIKIDGGFTIQ